MSDQLRRQPLNPGNGDDFALNGRFSSARWVWLPLAFLPLLVWFAWSRGRNDAATGGSAELLRVTGSSMVPTLAGRFEVASCPECQLRWRVEVTENAQVERRVENDRTLCSHCGARVGVEVAKRSDRGLENDVVRVRRSIDGELHRGDLVAIRWDRHLRVKRMAALPGDTVDLDGLHLIVNGTRLEDLLFKDKPRFEIPQFLVDADARRAKSRWSPNDASAWERDSERKWHLRKLSDSWLVYSHRSAHDHNRVSQVWDDYPFNISVQRKLHGVDRFLIRGDLECDTTIRLEVAMWSRDGARLAAVSSGDGHSFEASWHAAELTETAPVNRETPIAIRVRGGKVAIGNLTVHRLTEYRIRPRDDRMQYPMQIGPGQCFVVGDNVPVSVDSRDIGSAPLSDVVGMVEEIYSANAMEAAVR